MEIHWYLVAAILVQDNHISGTSLTFQNNRYDDFLVAISPRVKQDPRIIREIISTFTMGSTYIHRVTKHRAYFGRVKILMPNTWDKDPSWSLATTETFEDADMRVDRPHVSHGSDPYTFQPGLCGDPGKYIHVTPGYLTDEKGDRYANYGDPGGTIVHEFSHLRYGVFDEYGLGTEEYPYVYLDDEDLFPTACSNTIQKGSYHGNCTINTTTNKPDNSCFFVADRDSNTGATVMYDPSVNKVTNFCESNSDNPDYIHNPLAPNQQNKMCDGKGTWDVIMEHPDFKGGNQPVFMTSTQLRPSFSILYEKRNTTSTGAEVCGRPVVLVLDLSEQMKFNDRYFKQIQTADKLIRDVLPVGTKVGVVTSSTDAIVRFPLAPLLTPSDRDRVARRLPDVSEYGGPPGIGSGILAAYKLLEAAEETAGGRIVLLSNGQENVQPNVQDIKGEIIQSGIRVHTVAYRSASSVVIRQMTKETGGEYFFYSDSANSTILEGVVETLRKDIDICHRRDVIEIMRRATELTANSEVVEDIIIDSTVGNDTMFVFTLLRNAYVNVTLMSPENKLYNSSSKEYSLDSKLNIVRFHFVRCQSGTWHYSLTSASPGTVTLVVKALPGGQADPYQVDSWLSSMFGDVTYGSKPTVVYVHVHKGYSPVTDADVTVTVERPSPALPVTLKPLDSGILPDSMANDGVYSIYFTQFEGNDRYPLHVEVKTIPGQTQYHKTGPVIFGGAQARFHNTTPPVEKVLADNFTRTTSPGAMDVKGFTPGKDNYPPNRVTDLRVVTFDRENRTVTLTWTAPGDDLSIGQASRYDIRMAITSGSFTTEFTKLDKVEPDTIIPGKGSFSPQPAQTTEIMTLRTPSNWTTVVYALQTYDDAGLVSPTSNVATVTFKEVKIKGLTTTTTTTAPTTTTTTTTTTTATTTTTTTTTTTATTITLTKTSIVSREPVQQQEESEIRNNPNSFQTVGFYVGVTLGVAFGFVGIFVVIYCVLKRHGKKRVGSTMALLEVTVKPSVPPTRYAF